MRQVVMVMEVAHIVIGGKQRETERDSRERERDRDGEKYIETKEGDGKRERDTHMQR